MTAAAPPPPVPLPAAPVPPAARRSLPARPRLDPGTARAWRSPSELQLGRAPAGALVVAGLTREDAAVLELLDGTRDAAALRRDAVARGCSPERVDDVVRVLDDAGALDDAAAPQLALPLAERDRLAPDAASLRRVSGPTGPTALSRRRAARVLVVGGGRVGGQVAALLAAAGVGTVDVTDDRPVVPGDTAPGAAGADDVGRRRDGAVRRAIARIAPEAVQDEPRAPHLVVVAPAPASTAARAVADAPRGVPLLVVEVRDATAVVGPLVLPGESACPGCLDQARADADPAWGRLLGQLDSTERSGAACDVVLAAAAAAQAAAQALALLDEGPLPAAVDGTLELSLPDWRWRRRSWRRHPACAC